jgi:DNA-binding NarL/FixJ family response regulator
MSIRIVLADDHTIVRQGLRNLLEAHSDYKVIAEAEDGKLAIQLTNDLLPDLVIMDITMPDINGIDAARQISAKHPNIKIIALSMHSDRRFVTEMLDAGASGYLLKDCALEELTHAIQAVLSDQVYVSPAIANIVIQDLNEKLEQIDSSTSLSQKEQLVLRLLAEGINTKSTAAQLHVSIKTIETHRQHIMEKLGLHSIAELTKYAIRKGLTSLEE